MKVPIWFLGLALIMVVGVALVTPGMASSARADTGSQNTLRETVDESATATSSLTGTIDAVAYGLAVAMVGFFAVMSMVWLRTQQAPSLAVQMGTDPAAPLAIRGAGFTPGETVIFSLVLPQGAVIHDGLTTTTVAPDGTLALEVPLPFMRAEPAAAGCPVMLVAYHPEHGHLASTQLLV
jgi:hypothetical protein